MKKYRYNGQDEDCYFEAGDICIREGDSDIERNGEYKCLYDGVQQTVLDSCMEEIE